MEGDDLKSFDELKLSEPLARAVTDLGYTVPTPIQAQALPVLLGGPTDFIGMAGTGTGKTAAFGIPLIEQIDASKRHVQGLVLCPTRELAIQVCGQLNLMGKHKGIKALPVYGGTGYGEQQEGLRHGVQIVVGTPGRLIDHLDRRALTLDAIKTVVLDEADEMISMGFRDDLEKILKSVPREKSHIWLFSATMSGDVRRVADTYLRHPKQVQVNRTEMLSTTVEQIYYTVRESDKPEILCKIVEATEDFYGLVFCQTKALVAELSEYLQGRGLKVDCLHGDKSQDDRERTMRAFRDKKVTLLICTDVASRGLDVKELTHVINYSVPKELDVYVHRIGRTARSGKPGTAISFMIPTHRHLISRLEHWTKSKMKEGKVPSRKDIATKKVSKLLERFLGQKHFARAAELLGPDWKAATGEMSPDEVIGRFIAMTSPELFEERPKEKPFVQAHVPRPSHPYGAGARPAKGPWKKTHNKVNRGQGAPR
jgi:ATP-dependent RNA helicase DeaD